MSPLTPDERAIFAENVRDAIRIVGDYHGDPEYKAFLGASLGVLADKLEAELEPLPLDPVANEHLGAPEPEGGEPLRFTLRYDAGFGQYRVSVPNPRRTDPSCVRGARTVSRCHNWLVTSRDVTAPEVPRCPTCVDLLCGDAMDRGDR